jgi:hypothetical protein
MPITATVTNLSKRVNPQGVDLATGLKIALFTSSATITAASTLYSGLTNEVSNSGTNYTTGGNAVSASAWSGTTSPKFTGTIASWAAASFTFRYAVIYDTATSKIIGFYNFNSDQQVVSGTVALTFDTNGMLLVTST